MTKLLAVIIASILFAPVAFGSPALLDPGAFDLSNGLLLAGAVSGGVAAGGGRSALAWSRKRDFMKVFSNVPSGVPTTVSTVFSAIPRLPRTLYGFALELGGTTFTKALISRVEIFLGETSIWGPVSGTELDVIDTYINSQNLRAKSDNYLPIDFVFQNIIEQGGNQIGGLDLTQLPGGDLRLEVDMAVGVSAPTIRGDAIWGPLQSGRLFGGSMMRKLVKRAFPQAPAGDFEPDIQLRGGLLARSFLFSSVATAAVTAAQTSEGVANTGDGVMGAVTVTARTKTGRYKWRIIEPAANAGRFAVYDPDGILVGTGTVAVAFSAGGLAFTLADGATDFVAGDGGFIDVLPLNTNQNVNDVQVFKSEELLWRRSDRGARFEQGRWGRTPLSQLYVADFIGDNRIDGVLDTLDAPVDFKMNLTAADTVTMIHETLAEPMRFSRAPA